MPGKTAATKVPYRLTFNTNPSISLDMGTHLELAVLGKKRRVIARVRFTKRNLEILGSDESKPMRLPYRYLKRKGVDQLRDSVEATVKGLSSSAGSR